MAKIATGVVDNVDEVGGEGRLLPGFYHMVCTDVQEEAGKNGEHLFDFEILAGTVPSMQGRKYRLTIANEMKKWPVRKLLAFTFATGLNTPERQKAAEKAGEDPDIDLTAGISKQVVMELEESEYNEKVRTQLAWDNIYAVIDKRVAHVPLNKAWIDKAGIKLPEGRPVEGASKQREPERKPKASRESVAAAVDDLDI